MVGECSQPEGVADYLAVPRRRGEVADQLRQAAEQTPRSRRRAELIVPDGDALARCWPSGIALEPDAAPGGARRP